MTIVYYSSCKSDVKNAAGKIDDELPIDFVPFYQDFHADSLFQLAHIVFPLEGKREETSGTIKWKKDQWVFHKPFDGMGTFKRDFSAFNGIVIEKINDGSGQYNMERRWSKFGDDWYLIFYKEMGRK